MQFRFNAIRTLYKAIHNRRTKMCLNLLERNRNSENLTIFNHFIFRSRSMRLDFRFRFKASKPSGSSLLRNRIKIIHSESTQSGSFNLGRIISHSNEYDGANVVVGGPGGNLHPAPAGTPLCRPFRGLPLCLLPPQESGSVRDRQ